ncbi:hypothetical protein VTJ49DRAFT_2649 [Mycothermus thermophilus]|uniref:NUDE domain-containing protein n=1 Tax=Humicola insolens TaxID=85995 RepID=A0ABR3V9J2_HUMIN
MSEPPSSPPRAGASVEDELAWYKSQYETLEAELAEFQASSKELEAELEKDLDAADKRERQLRQKAEELSYEVEEWKRKYKESKAEANSAQNALEKEITNLREANRTLQLKLRDIEVANDDFERQARHTTSSLEDLESKYNVAIERAVMLEEEIKIGEQEREQLRVESQRLREELADLKIEAEILQDKLKKQESHISSLSTDASSIPGSPSFCNSPHSTASSPMIMTPPDLKALSAEDATSELQDPPSPPMSDASLPLPRIGGLKTPAPGRKSRLPSVDGSITPKPRTFTPSTTGSRLTRTTSISSNTSRSTTQRPSATQPTRNGSKRLPASNSLTQIRHLTAQMARLEARVQSARAKLPATAPTNSPPRSSPRPFVPSTVTIRSRKRSTASNSSSVTGSDTTTPSHPRHAPSDSRSSIQSSSTTGTKHVPRLSTSGVSRLSFGPLPNRNPTSASSTTAPTSHPDHDYSRPSSRASITSGPGYGRPASRAESHTGHSNIPPRPMSRASLSGARTPLGISRPRSSLGTHAHNSSISSGYPTYATAAEAEAAEAEDEVGEFRARTPSRRGTYSRLEMEAAMSGIPLPGSGHTGIPKPGGATRRLSGGSVSGGSGGVGIRRASAAARTPATAVVRGDLGETY